MDEDRTTRGFQRWLDMLDEHEVQAQIDAVQHELEQLERRRELLLQALALKHDWDTLLTPHESESPGTGEESHFATVAEGQGYENGFFGPTQPEDSFVGGQTFDAGSVQ
jgi:hypothetical protein